RRSGGDRMRLLLHHLVAGVLLVAGTTVAPAQAPAVPDPDGSLPPQQTAFAPAATLPEAAPPASAEPPQLRLPAVARLRRGEAPGAAGDEDHAQKKNIQRLQKQIDTRKKRPTLGPEQLKRPPPPGLAGETLQARSAQAARRDVELANAVDDIRD